MSRIKQGAAQGNDPNYDLLARMIAAAGGDPVLTLAIVVSKMHEYGRVTPDSLARLGISEGDLFAVLETLKESDTPEEVNVALDLQAALHHYNAILVEIANERGVPAVGEVYVKMCSDIAAFAERNAVLDLRIAYRLMLAECPHLLPGFNPSGGD
jgi:hypothetical protein